MMPKNRNPYEQKSTYWLHGPNIPDLQNINIEAHKKPPKLTSLPMYRTTYCNKISVYPLPHRKCFICFIYLQTWGSASFGNLPLV